MREIKFRAFDGNSVRYDVTGFEQGKENEMAGVFLDGDYYEIVESLNEDKESFHPLAIVNQFIGLTDRNGVDIYEGDILEEEGVPYETGDYARTVICFLDGEFKIKYQHQDKPIYEHISRAAKEIIVGNIYENAELLK